MAFVNPEVLRKIFARSPDAPKGQELWQMLAGAGAGMTQAAGQPGAGFAQALGGGVGGMLQGQQAAQQYQMNQLKMQQAEAEAARQERMAKIMGDILQPKGSGFAGQVATGPVQTPQLGGGGAVATPYQGQGPGALSARYESSGGGVGTVSTGRGDPGGRSYGTHQLSSNAGTMSSFLQSPEGQPFAQHFSGQQPGTDQFDQSYQEVVQGAGPAFEQAQQQYLQRTHVQPVMEAARNVGLPVESPAIQQALYSQAIQHSGNGNLEILNTVAAQLGPNAPEDKVIEALYDTRERYAINALKEDDASEEVIAGVRDRYRQERQDALALTGARRVGAMIGGPQGAGAPPTPQAAPQAAPQPALNGYQQADARAQASSPVANLPPETRQLLSMLDPEDAAKAILDMQPGPPDLPAEVDALRWAFGDDDKAKQEYLAGRRRKAQASMKPGVRAQKISDYQSLYGFSKEQATKVADDLAKFELNENTGRVIFTDFTTGEVREITPTRTDGETEPELRGPTLWDVAERGNPTGLGSGIAETANRIGGQVGLNVGEATVAQRRYFQNATQDFIRALAINERFPVAEMERIRKEVDLDPSVFSDESTFKASMRSLDTTLRDRIDYYKWVADDPSASQDLREAMGSAARQMEWFRKRLGVPQDGGVGGQGAAGPAPAGWEDDWEFLTPEERQEVLQGGE